MAVLNRIMISELMNISVMEIDSQAVMGDDAGPEHHAVQGWYRSKSRRPDHGKLERRSSSIQSLYTRFDTSFDNDKR